jgi:hypothetical protein
MEEIRSFLKESCGLELSTEKTRITHIRDGYNFLGFNISRGTGKSGKFVPKIKVGLKAVANIQQRLGEAIRYRPAQESISVRLVRASAIIRGWSNYFKVAHNFSRVAHRLDHKAYWITVKTICRKEDITTAQCLRKYSYRNTIGIHEERTLVNFQDTKAAYYLSSPEPYQPGCNQPYPEDDNWEVGFVQYDRTRPGSGDLKWKALARDNYRCRNCGEEVSITTSIADHIIPVKCFANFTQAHKLDNIQTLCLKCHKRKSASEK